MEAICQSSICSLRHCNPGSNEPCARTADGPCNSAGNHFAPAALHTPSRTGTAITRVVHTHCRLSQAETCVSRPARSDTACYRDSSFGTLSQSVQSRSGRKIPQSVCRLSHSRPCEACMSAAARHDGVRWTSMDRLNVLDGGIAKDLVGVTYRARSGRTPARTWRPDLAQKTSKNCARNVARSPSRD
jgi:hypothetical protein